MFSISLMEVILKNMFRLGSIIDETASESKRGVIPTNAGIQLTEHVLDAGSSPA